MIKAIEKLHQEDADLVDTGAPIVRTGFRDYFRFADKPGVGRSNRNVEYGHFSASACAFQRLANREQEDGTLTFRVRRKEVNHVIVEEG